MTYETEYGALGRSHDSELRTTDRRIGDLEDRVAELEEHAHAHPPPPPEPEPEPPAPVITLVALEVQPSFSKITSSGSTTLTVWGTYSDTSRSDVTDLVGWDLPDGGTMAGAIFTAPGEGFYQVIAFDPASGIRGSADVLVEDPVIILPPPPPQPPQSHPLLAVPSAAVLAQQVWTSYASTGDLCKQFSHNQGQLSSCATGQAVLQDNPTYGKVARCFQGDGITDRITVGHDAVFSRPASRVWAMIPIRYQKGFNTDGPGGENPAWKCVFGSYARQFVWYNGDKMNSYVSAYGGTTARLADGNSRVGATWYAESGEWTDEKWSLYVVCEEALSTSHYRNRRWIYRVNDDGTLGKLVVRHGYEATGAVVPLLAGKRYELGINRNREMFAGQRQWFEWGPYVMWDADVFEHPALARDMLR